MDICKSYNYDPKIEAQKDELIPPQQKATKKPSNPDELKPWKDYNDKIKVWDLVQHEFSIVRNQEKKGKVSARSIILRNGSESTYSGYIYEDSGCMFLFSTGTIYPPEKLLTPFEVYTYQNHNGNFSKANAALYHEGYGDREVKHVEALEETPEEPNPIFPIDVFPEWIRDFVNEHYNVLGFNTDAMSLSIISAISSIIGNKITLEAGWKSTAVLWFVIVGKAGSNKSHPLAHAFKPLLDVDFANAKEYMNAYRDFEEYEKLPAKEKANIEKVEKPYLKQLVVQDTTVEALVQAHSYNPNGMVLYMDELSGFWSGMNQYKGGKGNEESFWLKAYNNGAHVANRKMKDGIVSIERTFVNIIGTIQTRSNKKHYTKN